MVTSIRLDEELRRRLQTIAEQERRSAHWIMREAIEQYVDRAEKQGRFLQEAKESWAHYKETGLHLTLEEVDAWLATWGTDEKTELPPCHE